MRALAFVLSAGIVLFAWMPTALGRPPVRSVADLATAIGYSRPDLPEKVRKTWATLLAAAAKRGGFDALSGWAIIHHESRWRERAVSADGQDIGLAQIRVGATPACRDRESAACLAYRERLFDPATNMAAMAHAIAAWRTLCITKTGKADFRHWLAGYGGFSRPPTKLCGRARIRTAKGWRWADRPTPGPVKDILALRRSMIRRLSRPKRHRRTSTSRRAATSPSASAGSGAASLARS